MKNALASDGFPHHQLLYKHSIHMFMEFSWFKPFVNHKLYYQIVSLMYNEIQ